LQVVVPLHTQQHELAHSALVATTAASTLFAAGSANAASELMDIAALDSRAALLGTLFVPVLGWVGFNILPGLFNQLQVSLSRRGGEFCSSAGSVRNDKNVLSVYYTSEARSSSCLHAVRLCPYVI
jgi:hypothetical protein